MLRLLGANNAYAYAAMRKGCTSQSLSETSYIPGHIRRMLAIS